MKIYVLPSIYGFPSQKVEGREPKSKTFGLVTIKSPLKRTLMTAPCRFFRPFY